MMESISLAFLTLLEQLTPAERAVFLLREVFDLDYDEIATIVGKEEAACRQLCSRAAKHMAAHRPRFRPTADQHRRLLEGFMRAVGTGSRESLLALLADDVTLSADGGGKARGAATHPLHGRDPVARFLLASTRFLTEGAVSEVVEVNGQPAGIIRTNGAPTFVIAVDVCEEQITHVRVLANPEKLRWLS